MFIKFPPIDANNLINDFNNLILVDILRYWIEDRIWMYSVAFAFLFCFIQILLFNKIDSFNLYILGFNFFERIDDLSSLFNQLDRRCRI